MRCLLYYGDNSVSPPKPAILYIPMGNINGWPTAYNTRFMVANVRNPSTVGMNVGVTLKMYKACVNKYNGKCALLEARGFYVTTASTENVQTSASSFTPSSNVVLDTGINHQFVVTTTAAVDGSDVIYIFYPTNFEGILHSTCSAGGNYYCYSYPIPRWIVLVPQVQVISGAGTLTINLVSYMRNGYYAQSYEENIVLKICRDSGASTPDVYNILQNPHVPIARSISSGTATSMTITATQNTDVFLRNYANTVEIVLDNLFMDSRIKAIYIKAPAEVTHWD